MAGKEYIRFQPKGTPLFGRTSEGSESSLPNGFVFAYDDFAEPLWGDWSPFTRGIPDDVDVLTFTGTTAYDPGDAEGIAVKPVCLIRRESPRAWLVRISKTAKDVDYRNAARELLRSSTHEWKRTGKSLLRELHKSEPLAALILATSLRYPPVGEVVASIAVRQHVPNLSSIDGYFAESKTLSGIRAVPMSDLGGPRSVFYAADDFARSERLADAIRASGEINPLIIGVDEKGAFIIEGAHRFVALWYLKMKEFPAVVVVGKD